MGSGTLPLLTPRAAVNDVPPFHLIYIYCDSAGAEPRGEDLLFSTLERTKADFIAQYFKTSRFFMSQQQNL